jgi:polar amino acid transport system substrate-binding protein
MTRALRVASAFPDPPFEESTDPPSGLDVDLMRAVAERLGRPYELHRFEGDDFDGIYAGLASGDVDVVTSGATITDHRTTLARFCAPYLRSGQSLVVDVDRSPAIRSTDDLRGAVVGVQKGNTSEPVVDRLLAQGRVGDVRHYDYDAILTALDDLVAGRIAAFMKLEPVMRRLTRDRPSLRIVQTGITRELIASAVRSDDASLATGIDGAQRSLAAEGTLAALGRRWLADSDPAATMMITGATSNEQE